MNKHIQELAKRAADHYWSLNDGVRTADAYTQQFAELIVKDILNDVRWYSLAADDIDDSIKYIRHKVSKRYGIDLFDDIIKR